MESSTWAIELSNLKFSYARGKGPHVLNIPRFQVARGEKIFLHGPSGSGKSTLLGLLGGVLVAQEGRVQVLDQDLKLLSSRARDRFRGEKVGFIFQVFNLISYLSPLENIVLPSQIHPKRFKVKHSSQEIESSALRLAQELGIHELLGKQVGNLSLGQQQRVAVARALLGNPELIIADEPTSALDKGNAAKFLELLLKEWEQKKFTLIFVGHDETLAKHFDRRVSLLDLHVGGV